MASKICGAHFSDIQYAGATLAEVDRCFTFAADDDEGMDCDGVSDGCGDWGKP